ncbi:MAG TPA: hypothetical protein VKU61_14410 [Candidatus Binatia bacterium]|nr:hypothetical protein [Candidatus Binatia bacterium]
MYRRHPLAGEALLSAGAAASIAALLAYLGPPGSDLAAHAYQRTLFLEHGFTLWNNFWYAGRYSFITYSLIYYPLAGALGIRLLAVATIALASLAFAVVVWREWGPTTRWSSRTFAVVWAGIVLSAAFPFALGIAIALLALWALQAGARWRFAGLALLTLAASPVAFLLLVVVLAGVALARRASVPRNWVAVATIGVAGGIELVLWRLFPGGGSYPFSSAELAAGVTFCLLGLAFTWRLESARILRYVFAVYVGAMVVAYVVPSAVGENVARMRYAAIPLAVLVLSLRKWKPLVPGLAVIALAFSWNITPLVSNFENATADATTTASAWTGAISFLKLHAGPNTRVESVDTTGHWGATYLADADIPLARGWFRQDDFPANKVLYGKLGPRAYLQWLHGLGVGYVVLPTAAPFDYSARAEAKLVESGRAGLRLVYEDLTVAIYRVPHFQPIVTGPGRALVDSMSQEKMVVSVPRGGTYRIAVRYSPYWRTSDGCLSKGKDGMLRLTTLHARTSRIGFTVSADTALDQLAGTRQSCKLP